MPGSESDMTKKALILVYGRELSLLETRCWVLEGAGFHVLSATHFDEATSIFDTDRPDLMILCHSLLPEQRQRILSATWALRPSRKVLVLAGGGIHAYPDDEGTAAIDSFDGPRVLLSTVNRMLSETGAN